MGQPWKKVNLICKKTSDRMEPSQPVFTSSAGLLAHFHEIQIEADQSVLGLHIFRNLAEEKINMAPVNMSKSGPTVFVNS